MNIRRLAAFLTFVVLSWYVAVALPAGDETPPGAGVNGGGSSSNPAVPADGAHPDGPYVEKFDSGKVKISATYKAGKLTGAYQENFENGKTKIRATYKDGQLQGNYAESYDTGHPKLTAGYRDGLLNGPYQEFSAGGLPLLRGAYENGKRKGAFVEFAPDGRTPVSTVDYDKGVPKKLNGVDIFPRTKEAILAELKAIYKDQVFTGKYEERFTTQPQVALPLKPGGLTTAYEADALAYLKAYRYLGGVPYKQIKPNSENGRLAQHIAVLCQYQFDIKAWPPPNPHRPPELKEVDRAFWADADKGGRGSNIYDHHKPVCSLRLGLIDWMRDSNEHNLHSVGHRRWILYPGIDQVGFGEAGRMCAMFYKPIGAETHTGDFIAWPPPGYLPVEYFGSEWAWSITLTNTGKYKIPKSANDYDVAIVPLDDDYNPAGEALKLNVKNLDLNGYGIANCLIWRPTGLKVEPGKKYKVDITLDKSDKAPAHIQYFVEFITDGTELPKN